MESKAINSIVIVGGGTAGWMTAASLSRHFRKTNIGITLVESSSIGTVGVGEATIPTLRRFYRELGFSDAEVIRQTRATCKLGIQFENWREPGSRFIHPFGVYGQKANGIDFLHYWMRLKAAGKHPGALDEYSLGVQLAKAHKFVEPSPNPPSELSIFDWALHFDASRFAELMRDCAVRQGVECIDARIESIEQDDSGQIGTLTLDTGATLSADLFVDCSGFGGLLIEKTLNTGYEDWSQWLPCDSAVAVQSSRVGNAPPYTVSKAHRAGWQWRIPLQHRQGNGHVYSSQHMSEDQAIATMTRHIEGELLHEPRRFGFTAGRRKRAWHRNVIAVGLAAGFLEPLESTSIALVETAIEKIRRAFPKPWYTQREVDTFNDLTAQEYERVRDFIVLHYKLNGRDDSDFWRCCRAMPIPETLDKKWKAYRERGELIRYPIEIFGPPSWLAIYDGFGRLPQDYDHRVDQMDIDYLSKTLGDMRRAVADTVASQGSHQAYIDTYCAAMN